METRFFLRRFFDDPWRTMAFVIFLVGWLIPFGYLLKRLTGRPPSGTGCGDSVHGLDGDVPRALLLVFPAVSG